MARQAVLDTETEDAKAFLPPGTSLEAVFATLDRFRKGYITDSDICQFCVDFGSTAGFSIFTVLVNEVLLRRPRETVAVPGRLTLRQLGTLVLPMGSQEYEACLAAYTDEELRSILYLLRKPTEQEIRQIELVPELSPRNGTGGTQYQLFRLIESAVCAADELETGRKDLQRWSASDGAMGMLSSVFAYIADGRLSFLMGDLRRAMFTHDIAISEEQLGLLWRRYAPRSDAEISFTDFVRQLKPRDSLL